MGEMIDIFNDRYEYLGTAGKKEAHAKGLWHRVFTCLIFSGDKRTMFLQRKRPNIYAFNRPDYMDISVGGHYEAGEDIASGIRELYEETGLTNVGFQDLIPIGIRQTAATISENYIANEFQHIFLLEYNGNPQNLVRPDDEVDGFVEVGITDVIKLLLHQTESITGNSFTCKDNTVISEPMPITLSSFVPGYLKIDQFMLRLALAANRYIKDPTDCIFW